MVDVQVRAADAGGLDAHDRVVALEQLRLRPILDPDLAGRLECHGLHRRTLHAIACRRAAPAVGVRRVRTVAAVTDAFYALDGDRVIAERAHPRALGSGRAACRAAVGAAGARARAMRAARRDARSARVTVEILAPVPIAPLTRQRPRRSARPQRRTDRGVATGRRTASSCARAAGAWPRVTSPPTGSRRSRRPAARAPRRSSSSRPARAVGWHTAMEIVFARGALPRARARPPSGCARASRSSRASRSPRSSACMLAADGGNGVSAPLDWAELHLHQHRPHRAPAASPGGRVGLPRLGDPRGRDRA